MNCPHCQKELPENYGTGWCPFCGKNLSPEAELSPTLSAKKRVQFNRRVFLSALLLPAVLTLLSAAVMRFVILSEPLNEGVSPWIGLVGGAIGGVICGVMIGRQSGQNLLVRIMLSIVMSAIMIVVCIMLCFFGCNIGGYQVRIGG